jgi:hypothetical protein
VKVTGPFRRLQTGFVPLGLEAIAQKNNRQHLVFGNKNFRQMVKHVQVRGKKYARHQHVGMIQGYLLIQVFIDYPGFNPEAPSVEVSAYNAGGQEQRWYKKRGQGKR